ncbi:hypothetical protein LRS10_13165 [Phenylobacterium sp. J426]|uniref:hypothetical protein n=1 Tax=Phenylobacterium sp. J426 TaxID=2898439 RepID=UPI002151298D|nr:hypothetical protein [Phenylobacterium sp. J426]MCR5875047.1 hypothetical protein [Phenylobacterium sp. J426]
MPGAPADPRPDNPGVGAPLDLDDLGEVDVERLGDDPTPLVQDLIEVVVVQHEVAEVGEGALAPDEFAVIGHPGPQRPRIACAARAKSPGPPFCFVERLGRRRV